MNAEITGLCRAHSFETAEDVCRRCGAEYCELCLVFPFGDSKPLCKECAMAAGGVRSHVSRPAMGRRDLRRTLKAFEARRRGAGTAADDLEPSPVLTDPLAPTSEDLERTSRIPDPAPEPAAWEQPDEPDESDESDDDAFVEELASAFAAPSPVPNPPPAPAPAPPSAPTRDQPADGVAPPIDWNRPFG